MIDKKYRNLFIWPALGVTFILLFLTACGTLEIDIEQGGRMSSNETVSTTIALTSEQINLATSEVIATPVPVDIPTPIPAVTELHVAFVQDTEHGNNAWLWTEGEGEAVPLTKDGGVSGVKISDDGEIVAFMRGDSLWMVTSDGADSEHPSEERVLVSVEDIAAMQVREPFDYEVVLNHFDWVPGTHILAFNTRLQMQIGLSLNNDLHLVNADTLEYTALLPPGKGGEFHPSPDGRQIAVVTPGAISLVRIDGSDRREVFTYTPIVTYSEVRYYAQPVWAADSGSLRVAIPPVDPHVHPLPPTSVWHIRTDGSSARLLGNVQARQMMPSVISTDLQYIAHLDIEQPDLTLPPMVNLLITDLDNRETITYYPIDSTETFTQHPAATLIYGWSSDSQRLIFQGSLHDLATQALVGQIGGDVVPVYADTDFVMDVRWVDARRYLFLAQGSRGWSIVLGDIGGSVKGVASVAGDYPTFDFSSPPHDSTASGG